jgi:hypothetical protein
VTTALVFEPATAVPVASQVGGEPRDNNDMTDARLDPRAAAGAHICLASLIRLNGVDGCIVKHHPKNPHATNASVNTTNTTTSTMSAADRL